MYTHPVSSVRGVVLGLALVVSLLAMRPETARAQASDDVPLVTRTYVLENARVVQAPGRVLDRATVVIRDGLLVAVGPDAAVPFDAERIAADSLVVYAGFIDGLSHVGIPKPKDDDNRERPKDPANPPDEQAGIVPHHDARTMLDPADKSIEKLREAGFTVAHTVPHGGMLPGAGAVILLAGDAPNALVIRGDASLFAQLDGARGMYPGTDMAVLAKLRQLYREAQRRQRMEALYAQNPAGLERPAYDPVHYAFFPVLDGGKRIFFHTEDALDLHRVLDARQDLGFPLVLTGLNQSFDAVAALTQAGVPLLLTLDLPEEKKKDKAKKDTTATGETEAPVEPEATYNPALRTRTHADVEDEKKNLEARQATARKQYYATAATLHEAGLRFGFTTMDAKPEDVMKNLRTMIAHGLPEDAALAALTTHAAEILGIAGSTGTVEPGKMANLVVASGPLFAEDTKLRYVFVDGRKFEIEAAKKPSGAAAEGAVNPAGVWSFSVDTPQGVVGGTITIEGSPGDWSGTIVSDQDPDEPADLENVVLDGDVLSFSFDSGEMGQLTVTVTLDSDDLEGTVEVPGFGAIPLTGTRISGPDF